jgi:hypothetical protein
MTPQGKEKAMTRFDYQRYLDANYVPEYQERLEALAGKIPARLTIAARTAADGGVLPLTGLQSGEFFPQNLDRDALQKTLAGMFPNDPAYVARMVTQLLGKPAGQEPQPGTALGLTKTDAYGGSLKQEYHADPQKSGVQIEGNGTAVSIPFPMSEDTFFHYAKANGILLSSVSKSVGSLSGEQTLHWGNDNYILEIEAPTGEKRARDFPHKPLSTGGYGSIQTLEDQGDLEQAKLPRPKDGEAVDVFTGVAERNTPIRGMKAYVIDQHNPLALFNEKKHGDTKKYEKLTLDGRDYAIKPKDKAYLYKRGSGYFVYDEPKVVFATSAEQARDIYTQTWQDKGGKSGKQLGGEQVARIVEFTDQETFNGWLKADAKKEYTAHYATRHTAGTRYEIAADGVTVIPSQGEDFTKVTLRDGRESEQSQVQDAPASDTQLQRLLTRVAKLPQAVKDKVVFAQRRDQDLVVGEVQEILGASGDYKGERDQDFGRQTRDAVKRLQGKYGLAKDGAVGLRTAVALEIEDARTKLKSAVASGGVDAEESRKLSGEFADVTKAFSVLGKENDPLKQQVDALYAEMKEHKIGELSPGTPAAAKGGKEGSAKG